MLTKLFSDFFKSERAGGIVLMICAALSLTLTNIYSPYHEIWNVDVGGHALTHWINDGLMAVFFLLIGLELEREVYIGELSTVKKALLPIIAALGGMIVPALIYTYFNFDGAARGFGIPMATDIAFALGVLSLLGNRVPLSLKIFLTALAVIDDLGAILVIAIFYTSDLNLIYLGIAFAVLLVLFALNRFKVFVLWPYLIGGVLLWYFMLHSGVHATLAGVLLAFAIPFGNGDENSIAYKLQHFLHRPVAFFILPVFALANTSIILPENFLNGLMTPVSIGIMTGLFLGKPAGIFLFSFISAKMKITTLPADSKWVYIFGAAILGGIGFTMSIFISLLAFGDPSVIDQAKISVMIASVVAAIVGLSFLKMTIRK